MESFLHIFLSFELILLLNSFFLKLWSKLVDFILKILNVFFIFLLLLSWLLALKFKVFNLELQSFKICFLLSYFELKSTFSRMRFLCNLHAFFIVVFCLFKCFFDLTFQFWVSNIWDWILKLWSWFDDFDCWLLFFHVNCLFSSFDWRYRFRTWNEFQSRWCWVNRSKRSDILKLNTIVPIKFSKMSFDYICLGKHSCCWVIVSRSFLLQFRDLECDWRFRFFYISKYVFKINIRFRIWVYRVHIGWFHVWKVVVVVFDLLFDCSYPEQNVWRFINTSFQWSSHRLRITMNIVT